MNVGLNIPLLTQIHAKPKEYEAKINNDYSDSFKDYNVGLSIETIDIDDSDESAESKSFRQEDNYSQDDELANRSVSKPHFPVNYPPPLPKLLPEFRELAFTHKSCAEHAALLKSAISIMQYNRVSGGNLRGITASENVYVDDPERIKPIYDNEVSEFVGDSILGMIVTLLLRQWYPHLRPNSLSSEIRSHLVDKARLSDWAKMYSFDKHLNLPPSQSQLAIRLSPAVLCGTFEAYVACVFDQEQDEMMGMMAVKNWIEPLCKPYADMYNVDITNREKEFRETPKLGSLSYLNQMMVKSNLNATWNESGGYDAITRTQNNWVETLTLTLNNNSQGTSNHVFNTDLPATFTGSSSKKKEAKEIAAFKALKVLGINSCELKMLSLIRNLM
ncbi:ribonuclease III [Wallemia mellicola]|nr:ribonuclease III [Wallemia mellicola]